MLQKMICRPVAVVLLLHFCLFDFAAPTTYAASLEWVRQLGTSNADNSEGVSADGLGNVYISGLTNGCLGGTNAGSYDAYVAKYADPIVPEPSSLAGDMDLDGDVDFDDINPFVLALLNECHYAMMFGVPPELYGDIDGSGNHDFDDIPGFVAIIVESNANEDVRAVPEPSTLVVAGIGSISCFLRCVIDCPAYR